MDKRPPPAPCQFRTLRRSSPRRHEQDPPRRTSDPSAPFGSPPDVGDRASLGLPDRGGSRGCARRRPGPRAARPPQRSTAGGQHPRPRRDRRGGPPRPRLRERLVAEPARWGGDKVQVVDPSPTGDPVLDHAVSRLGTRRTAASTRSRGSPAGGRRRRSASGSPPAAPSARTGRVPPLRADHPDPAVREPLVRGRRAAALQGTRPVTVRTAALVSLVHHRGGRGQGRAVSRLVPQGARRPAWRPSPRPSTRVTGPEARSRRRSGPRRPPSPPRSSPAPRPPRRGPPRARGQACRRALTAPDRRLPSARPRPSA